MRLLLGQARVMPLAADCRTRGLLPIAWTWRESISVLVLAELPVALLALDLKRIEGFALRPALLSFRRKMPI